MKITAVAITNILRLLTETPQRLHTASHTLGNGQLQHKPDKKPGQPTTFWHKHTVFSQARRMALHEVTHCDQLEMLIKKYA